MAPQIDSMRAFIDDFQALRASMRSERRERMAAFLSAFEITHRRLCRERVDFNLFSLLRMGCDEVRHSQVLAWFLDAGSGHGQGTAFLRAFVELCDLDIPVEAMNRYWVRTEFSGQESIIDVMVCRRREFLIYLENKVFAREGDDQLAREFRDMRRLGASLGIPEERQFAIFLTPQAKPPLSGDPAHWRIVSYDGIAKAFGELLPGISSGKVKGFLQDWVETIATFGGRNGMAI